MKSSKRIEKILGLGEYQPQTEYVCFLPWYGEFGWYIMNHVKRVHGYNHDKKIVCARKGHDCLFPTAHVIHYYDNPYSDQKRAGVGADPPQLKQQIINEMTEVYGDSITFVSPQDTSWEEKKSLAHIHFIPKPVNNFDLEVDVVITPRRRKLDRQRNFRHWQAIINVLKKKGYTVGACGSAESSFTGLKGLKHKSWEYVDVDSDVEMILKSKVVVGQESGLAYLAMLCEKPIFILDIPHSDIAKLHVRDPNLYIPIQKHPFPFKIKKILDRLKKPN